MNISTSIRPMLVAQATRHSWLGRGSLFNLSLSATYKGQNPEVNTDRMEVGR